MKTATRIISLLLIVSILGLTSCVTQDHRVVWETPVTETPISASPYYLTPENDYVSPEEYRIIEHFAFTKEAVGKVEGTTESEIFIDEELKDLISRTDASAVVNFEVYAQGHDPGSLFGTTFTRIFGGMMLGMGLMFLPWGDTFTEIGAWFSGIGGVSLGASYIIASSSESRWEIGFEGDLVRPLAE